MDGAAATHRSARILAPYLMVRGSDNAISCPIHASGSLVAPTGGTVSVHRPDGTMVVDGASVTVANSIATYTIDAASLPATESLGARWQVIWDLDFDSGVTPVVIRADAALVRHELVPTLTDTDLFRRVSALDPAGAAPISSVTTWQDKIDLAWGQILRAILAAGQRPDLIASPSALHDLHFAKTLQLIFEDLATRLNDSYAAIAVGYRDEYREQWRDLTYVVDADQDGRADTRRRKTGPTWWLGGFTSL